MSMLGFSGHMVLQHGRIHKLVVLVVGTGENLEEEDKPMQRCSIQLVTATGDWDLHAARPSEGHMWGASVPQILSPSGQELPPGILPFPYFHTVDVWVPGQEAKCPQWVATDYNGMKLVTAAMTK